MTAKTKTEVDEIAEPEGLPADPTKPFWQMLSLLVSLIGFLLTGAVLLTRGEILLMAVVKALGVFVGLNVFLKLLGTLWVAVLGFEVKPPELPETDDPVAAPLEAAEN